MRRPRIFLGLAVLLLLALVVPPFVNINRFRRSIVQSISQGLRRPVSAGAVKLTLLPRPAFVLQRFAVAEDSAYGTEPVLMADSVTASLRASTLWHGRLEIATLRFDAPSVNLTRNAAGHWNFETLLHSSSRPELPESSQPISSSAHMPFPYVEATQARVNFKLGAEKLPFSLEGADLAVWKESGSEWHLRLKARPVRTDLTVADAGQIRGDAVLLTPGPLEDAPIRMNLEWRQVELGEIGRMLHGKDNNWRGMVDWTAHAKGTLAAAQVSTEVRIAELRRAEFVPATEMDLHGRCVATYVRGSNALEGLQCSAPLSTGWLRLRGRSSLPLSGVEPAAGDLSSKTKPIATLALQHVPAQFALEVFRHIHPGVIADARMTGELNGDVDCRWAGIHVPHFCIGQLKSTALALTLPQLRRPVQLSPLTLTASAAPLPTSAKRPLKHSRSRNSGKRRSASDSVGIAPRTAGAWQLQPSRISIGTQGAGPAAMLTGNFTPAALSLKIIGPANLRDVIRLSRALRVPAFAGQVRASQGTAQLAVTLKAAWLPQPTLTTSAGAQVMFTPSQWTGNMQIRNATLTLYALPGPLQMASAQIDLTPAAVVWSRLSGSYGNIPFNGNLRWQTPCAASTEACSRSFALHLPNLNPATLIAALHKAKSPSSLLEVVNPWAPDIPQIPLLQGTIDADTLTLGKLSIRNAELHLQMAGHAAELLSFSGNVFGGTISAGNAAAGDNPTAENRLAAPARAAGQSGIPGVVSSSAGSARWGDGAPVYALHATLTRIQPDRVANLWEESWGSGVADGFLSVHTQGWSASDLAQHAQGNFSIHWANGALASSDSATPVIKFQSWRGIGQISDRKLVLRSSEMAGWTMVPSDAQPLPASASTADNNTDPAAAVQTVTGSISFGRVLDLQLQPSGILLTGPLDSPTVTTKGKPSGAPDNQPQR